MQTEVQRQHDDERWYYTMLHVDADYTPFKLRPYQLQGVEWLRKKKRAMLTDAPGLGKTPQSALAAEGKTLVICPNYLVEQWGDWLKGEDEASLERNFGEVHPNVDGEVAVCVGNRWKKERAIRSGAQWTIGNVEMLGTHKEVLLEQHYDTVIFDESHHLKNRNAIRSKVAVELGKRIPRVYLLTATPIWKDVDDLYMQLRILWPDVFTSYWQFVDKFCIADTTRWGTKVLGVKKSMIAELNELLNVLRLGRTYEQAGRDLPPIIEKFVKIELPDEAKIAYNQAVNEFRMEVIDERFTNYMAVIHALRQIVTGSFKLQAVWDLLADEVRKAVVFSWYKETAEQIAARLGDVEVVTGSDKVAERRAKALGDKHVSATISSLSEGIDLSDARTVIFAEENWTPGSNFQALSRIRRERLSGNNQEPVVVYYVHCKGTIDEVIHRRSRARGGTAKEIVKEALYL